MSIVVYNYIMYDTSLSIIIIIFTSYATTGSKVDSCAVFQKNNSRKKVKMILDSISYFSLKKAMML